MILNISVFLWFGAVCPWESFRVNDVIPIYRLIFLGILILLFRRLPMVFAIHKKISEIEEFQQAAFVGFFGPIGVSAIFYLYISIEFLQSITVEGKVRQDAAHLEEVMRVVIWFLAICSIIVHGLSIPLGKLGYHFPRTISRALSTSQENMGPNSVELESRLQQISNSQIRKREKNYRPDNREFHIGSSNRNQNSQEDNIAPEPSRPVLILDTPITGSQTPIELTTRNGPSRAEKRESSSKDESKSEGTEAGKQA